MDQRAVKGQAWTATSTIFGTRTTSTPPGVIVGSPSNGAWTSSTGSRIGCAAGQPRRGSWNSAAEPASLPADSPTPTWTSRRWICRRRIPSTRQREGCGPRSPTSHAFRSGRARSPRRSPSTPYCTCPAWCCHSSSLRSDACSRPARYSWPSRGVAELLMVRCQGSGSSRYFSLLGYGRYRARSPGPTSGVGMCHRPVAWKPSRPAHPAEHHAITVDATIDVRGPYSSTE